jgi:hypothetical protein
MTGYPAEAIPPIIDKQGRELIPRFPMPGHPVMNVAITTWELLALAHLQANEAAEAARGGQADRWRSAEERSAGFLRLAQELDPSLVGRVDEPPLGPMASA